MSVHIYMVRHGETYFNFLHRFQGWSDAPLTEKGIQDGYHAGTRLANVHFDGAYSSDLTRAIHTARYILTNNAASNFSDPTQLPDFREENFGAFEGISGEIVLTTLGAYKHDQFNNFSDVITRYSMADAMNVMAEADPFNLAENHEAFLKRIKHGFNDLLNQHHDGDNILLVSHGTTIRAIAEYFGRRDLSAISVTNGAVMQLDLSTDEQADIINFNDDTTVF